MNPFNLEFWIPIGVALLCGAIIGVERQLRGKPAGVRTSVLICFSTYVFVELGTSLDGNSSDPTRVIGQVVTGVGFLGAGVMFSREGVVVGVTTAAVIWALAAIGATIGLGEYPAAIAYALVTVLVLAAVDILESSARWFRRGVHGPDTTRSTRKDPRNGDQRRSRQSRHRSRPAARD